MRVTEVSQRYAKALFEATTEGSHVEEALNQIREINAAIEKDPELKHFFTSPIVKLEDHVTVVQKLLEKKAFAQEVQGLLLMLAQKRRFSLLPEIVTAFQSSVDETQGMTRGDVRSASTLFPEERKSLEATISKYTGKKAVFEYHEDQSLLGGLVARVGSYTFDDSLETQLRLMRDVLKKRRSN